MKTIDTLVDDIYSVFKGGVLSDSQSFDLTTNFNGLVVERITETQRERNYLSLSAVGSSCHRKLWYKINQPSNKPDIDGQTYLKFFEGHFIELLLLQAAKSTGHLVVAQQDTVEVAGVSGHLDCIIDGMLVDVKTASDYSFRKFKAGKLRQDDPFGYIKQLSSYLKALQDDKRLTVKNRAAFLVYNKNSAEICLCVYDLTEELKSIHSDVAQVKAVTEFGVPPTEKLPPLVHDNGNEELNKQCGWCVFKDRCWPDMKTYQYANGVKYFSKVVKEPRVKQVGDDDEEF